MIAGVIGYDSIRKHLAECGYHTGRVREKYHPETQDVYIDTKMRNEPSKGGGVHYGKI